MCNTEPRQRNLIIIFAVKSCVSDVISRLKTSYEASFFPSLHIRAIPTINFRQVTIFTQVGRFFSKCLRFIAECELCLVEQYKRSFKNMYKCGLWQKSHHITIWCHKFLWLIVGISFFLNLITSSIHSFCFLYSFCR